MIKAEVDLISPPEAPVLEVGNLAELLSFKESE